MKNKQMETFIFKQSDEVSKRFVMLNLTEEQLMSCLGSFRTHRLVPLSWSYLQKRTEEERKISVGLSSFSNSRQS